MTRTDLFPVVHKAVRAVLFDAARSVARANFADGAEAQRAADGVRRAFALLEEHERHEDEVVAPELHSLAPELHAAVQAEHVRIAGMQREIDALLARLPDARPGATVASAGMVAGGRRPRARCARRWTASRCTPTPGWHRATASAWRRCAATPRVRR